VFQFLLETAPVVQAGQGVMIGEIYNPFFGFFLFIDID